jgi:hypothetical protein
MLVPDADVNQSCAPTVVSKAEDKEPIAGGTTDATAEVRPGCTTTLAGNIGAVSFGTGASTSPEPEHAAARRDACIGLVGAESTLDAIQPAQ